jgi:hypothetical protein
MTTAASCGALTPLRSGAAMSGQGDPAAGCASANATIHMPTSRIPVYP